jgi:putative membrane protein
MSQERDEGRATEVREHLANERTLLSWVRTGVGLISVGIVVERAGAFMSARGGQSDILSGLFGLTLALLGCLTLILGILQFLRNRRRISRREFIPGTVIYLVVTAGSVALGGVSSSTRATCCCRLELPRRQYLRGVHHPCLMHAKCAGASRKLGSSYATILFKSLRLAPRVAKLSNKPQRS